QPLRVKGHGVLDGKSWKFRRTGPLRRTGAETGPQRVRRQDAVTVQIKDAIRPCLEPPSVERGLRVAQEGLRAAGDAVQQQVDFAGASWRRSILRPGHPDRSNLPT